MVLGLGSGTVQAEGLANGQLLIAGQRLTLDPATRDRTWDVHESPEIRTCFGASPCGIPAVGAGALRVLGELSGPGLPEPVTYQAPPGGSFVLPRFQPEGEYTLSNIRLVDAEGRFVANAEPSSTTFDVTEILLGRAEVRSLTLAELQARGISITQENFQAFSRLEKVTRPDGTTEKYEYFPDDVVKKATRRDGVSIAYAYDPANRVISATPTLPAGSTTILADAGMSYAYDGLSRLLSSQRLDAPSTPNTKTSVVFEDFDLAGRPKVEKVGQRPALTRGYDVFGRTVNLGLPLGIGAGGAFSYLRSYEASSKRLLSLTAQGGPSTIGASWKWFGDGRILSLATNGPLQTMHSFGYIGGPGAQPPDTLLPNPPPKWKLGTLTIGSGTASPSQWGQVAYGYRTGDNAKLSRNVTAGTLLADQGWAWEIDNALRLTKAIAGGGTATSAFERFRYTYGASDELRELVQEVAGETATQTTGAEGRPLTRTENGATETIRYDDAGRRIEDARFLYKWHWFGKLAEVVVKDTWQAETHGGQPVVSPYAGHKVVFEWDSLERLFSATHWSRIPGGGAEADRLFIGKREYLWEDQQLIAEVGKAHDGSILWRYSYVPGASGMDDQVQLRVERYDVAGGLQSDKLYAYLRDEQGTVLGLVDENGGTAEKPRLLQRYVYTPYGQAHVELGPELRSARFEQSTTSVTKHDGTQVGQSVTDTAHLRGAMRLDLSLLLDVATLTNGLVVERRLTDGSWGALQASELAIGKNADAPEELVLLPLVGWELGTTWRVRLTAYLKDAYGRIPVDQPNVEMALPPAPGAGEVGSISVSFEKLFPVVYEDYLAAGETRGGELPGGQPHLWQGHLVNQVLGLHLVRARVYDARTASFASSDPEEDKDSPNLFGYVAGRPHEKTDPLGLCVGGLPCPGWAQNQINYWKDTGTKVGKGLKEAYDIGYKPMVDQAKEIVAANVRLADSAWDATTGGGKYTRGQSREILDEYVLRSLEVALMVEGFRTPARLPSKATASAPRRWQDFLPEAERRTAEARASWAIPGMEVEASAVYRETFFTAHPELRGKVWVHHSVERQIPRRYPGRFKPAELDELPNLRGIPNETNPDIHLSKIRIEWNKFYREHPNPTREEILQMRDKVDDMFGAEFNPPLKPKG